MEVVESGIVVPRGKLLIAVDLAPFTSENWETLLKRITLAAARVLDSLLSQNSKLEWGFLFLDSRVSSWILEARVRDTADYLGNDHFIINFLHMVIGIG